MSDLGKVRNNHFKTFHLLVESIKVIKYIKKLRLSAVNVIVFLKPVYSFGAKIKTTRRLRKVEYLRVSIFVKNLNF